MNEKMWDEIINEGGEGYNPYRQTTDEDVPMWAVLDDELVKTQNLMNGTSTSDPEYQRLKIKYNSIKIALEIL